MNTMATITRSSSMPTMPSALCTQQQTARARKSSERSTDRNVGVCVVRPYLRKQVERKQQVAHSNHQPDNHSHSENRPDEVSSNLGVCSPNCSCQRPSKRWQVANELDGLFRAECKTMTMEWLAHVRNTMARHCAYRISMRANEAIVLQHVRLHCTLRINQFRQGAEAKQRMINEAAHAAGRQWERRWISVAGTWDRRACESAILSGTP